MFSKTLLLVLLGVACVLAVPNVDSRVDESVDRSIEDAWKKLELKFHQAIELLKATWEKVKAKGQKIINVNLKAIQEKGLQLLQEAKAVYKQVVIEGKDAAPEIQSINESLKQLAGDLKQTGSEAAEDAKQLVHEVVETVKEKLNKLKKEE